MLQIKHSALKKLDIIDPKRREAIKKALVELKSDPLPYKKLDVVKLKGYENTYRIRIGSLRVVYEVSWGTRIITIHYIGFREKAYR